MKRVSPWRGEKNDDPAISWMSRRPHQVLVTAVDQFNRSVEVHDIASRQVKDGRLNLETNTFGAGQVSQNGVETVARAGTDRSRL